MTAHTHSTVVPGCYRCELSADEVAAIVSEPSTPEQGNTKAGGSES